MKNRVALLVAGVLWTLTTVARATEPESNAIFAEKSEVDSLQTVAGPGVINWKWRELNFGLTPFAYVRLMYDNVESDDRYSFIGKNDGFILDNARIGFDFSMTDKLSMRLSLEAASDLTADSNTPIGEIDVRLRDGFFRYDPFWWIGLQGGQFKAPFAEEELRSTADLLFIDRAVEIEGVPPGRGFEEPGLEVDRQIGVMLSPRDYIRLRRFGLEGWPADLGFSYYLMVANGNGDNQFLNDNSKLMVIGRLETVYANIVKLGGAVLYNDRTEGNPPNQFNEDDTGYAADLLVTPGDLELFFQYVQFDTEFPTVGADDITKRGWHAQIGYGVNVPYVRITPAYRFAQYNPLADGGDVVGGQDGDDFRLDYHTIGLRLESRDLPISFFVNYTFTEEQNPNKIDNNRLQLLIQVVI